MQGLGGQAGVTGDRRRRRRRRQSSHYTTSAHRRCGTLPDMAARGGLLPPESRYGIRLPSSF